MSPKHLLLQPVLIELPVRHSVVPANSLRAVSPMKFECWHAGMMTGPLAAANVHPRIPLKSETGFCVTENELLSKENGSPVYAASALATPPYAPPDFSSVSPRQTTQGLQLGSERPPGTTSDGSHPWQSHLRSDCDCS